MRKEKISLNFSIFIAITAMDSMTLPPDMFGGPEGKFTPTQHLSSNRSRLSQIQDGKWKVTTDYFK